jgi:hypothetical protein
MGIFMSAKYKCKICKKALPTLYWQCDHMLKDHQVEMMRIKSRIYQIALDPDNIVDVI